MNKTILIVDDEPHIRLLLEQTLEDLYMTKPFDPDEVMEKSIKILGFSTSN